MAECLKCANCVRREVYDGQWGRFLFDKDCSAKVRVIKDGKLNPWDMICDKFELGEPKIVALTDEQKKKYSYHGY